MSFDLDEVGALRTDKYNFSDFIDDESSVAETVTTKESSESKQKRRQRKFVDLRSADKDFFKIKNGRKGKIVGFSTKLTPGVHIRNAVSGYFELNDRGNPLHRIGTLSEDLFFKVFLTVNGFGNEPRKLFYDNPQQCERHLKISIDDHSKTEWLERHNATIKMFNKQ